MYSRGGFNYAALNMPTSSRSKAMAAGLPSAGHVFSEEPMKPVRKHRTEQEYFEEDSDEEANAAYRKKESSDSEDDPLDAFMQGLQGDLERDEEISKKKESKKGKGKAVRQDIEDLDEQELYLKYMEENPTAGLAYVDDDAIIDYDEDGNPIIPERNRIIDPLPPVDHFEIEYDKFNKNFYEEHSDISRLNYAQLLELRHKLGIRVSGPLPPKPVSSFGHFGFDEQLMHYIRKSEYSKPTPIQAQGVPTGLGGRDVIGIAKTGSGKTAAFVWPMLVHIMDQKEIAKGDGPIGLILAPTRELAQQIYTEVKRFGKAYNIHCVCAYGGGNMYEQQKACENGPEVIVATPGRLIDLVKRKATNLRRVTYLVFDEADRMFDMGFEPQVRSIANHVRPDRQTQLFSATFRKKVERLARDILTDPVRIIQGDIGEANEDVTQIVEVLPTGPDKWKWLTARLVGFTSTGSVLIFVTKKVNSEELASNLKSQDFDVALLHGDMAQDERNRVITEFKKRAVPILVATDVAARGLDIPHIRTVVNYDVARDIDTHTHRIGRTGRAGTKGTAYTLITTKDVYFAGDLVRNLEGANQSVPQSLVDLANQNPRFKKTRFRAGHAKKLNKGGRGLGYRERPGFGSGDSRGGSGSQDADKDEDETAGLYESRVAAMKGAFAAQYKTHFKAASSDATGDEWNVKAGFVPPQKMEIPVPAARQPVHHGGLYGSLNSATNYLPGNVPRPSADKFYESTGGKSVSSSSRRDGDSRDGKDTDAHGASVSFRHRRGRFSETDDRRHRDSHGGDVKHDDRRHSEERKKEEETKEERKEDGDKEEKNEEENEEGEYGHAGTLMSIAFGQGTTDASTVFRGLQGYDSDDDDDESNNVEAEKKSSATQKERSRSKESDPQKDRYRDRSRSRSRERDRRRDRNRSRSRSRSRERDRGRDRRDRDDRRSSRDYGRDRGRDRDRYDRDRDRDSRGNSRRESNDHEKSRYGDEDGHSRRESGDHEKSRYGGEDGHSGRESGDQDASSKRRSRWDA